MRRTPENARTRLVPRLLTCALLITFVLPVAALESGALLSGIRSAELDFPRAVTVRNLELEIGLAVFEIEQGVLIPARPIDGRTTELVFIGHGRFRCDPPDEIEAGQLELFTGRRALDAPVDAAVLVVANPDTVSRLIDRPTRAELRPGLVTQARRVFRDWMTGPERRQSGVEAGIFRALVGDAAFTGYFALWCRSFELGDFVYQVDPEDQEPLTVASFVPIDVTGWDRKRLARQIRIQQRKGRWLGVRVDDLGAWDVWLSSPWAPVEGNLPGRSAFEAEHYEIDATLARRTPTLEGTVAIDLRAQSGGRRTVSLELFRDLEVRGVRDAGGRPLFFFRADREIVVLLDDAPSEGDRFRLVVDFEGHALRQIGPRTFDLESPDTWHPHCGTIDRATYDVTLRWPRKHDLIASGRLVDRGHRGRYRWERRVLETPSIAYSFVMGDFDIQRRRHGDVELTMAFNRRASFRADRQMRARAFATLERSLDLFEEVFGPYPLDQLTAVTIPRDHSLSLAGFTTLSESVVRPDSPLTEDELNWVRANTIAHEVAHHWWGNLVGWRSYRDQWLSEAMASYAALLYYAHENDRQSDTLTELSAGWRDSLMRLTVHGRTIESLGPVVLGARLNSSEASNGYQAIVFRKGTVVLSMLARTLGEERFRDLLRPLVEAAANRTITTEEFLRAVEHMSGVDLDGFARQFVYGTGIPRAYYTYEIAPAEAGGWAVQGEVNRAIEPHYRFIVERPSSSGWQVTRFASVPEEDTGTLSVPFQVAVEAAATDRVAFRGALGGGDSTLVRIGTLRLEGSHHPFTLETERRPVRLRLDPDGDLLAYFHAAAAEPKRVQRFRADDDLARGLTADAEAGYRQALDLPAGSASATGSLPWLQDTDGMDRREDARIRLALARLLLEQGRLEEVPAELDTADDLLEGDEHGLRMERDLLRSRLDYLQGDPESAYRRLRRTLRMFAPDRANTWRAVLWRIRLGSEQLALTEAYAWMAITAHETGKHEDARWALQEARQRGIDMDALAQELGS